MKRSAIISECVIYSLSHMVTAIASHRNLQAGDNAPQVHSPHFHLSFSHPKTSQSTSHSLCQRGFLPVSPHRAHSLLTPLPLPFHTCLIQFSIGNPCEKGKGGKVRKQELPLSPHHPWTCRRSKAGSRIYGKQHNLLP